MVVLSKEKTKTLAILQDILLGNTKKKILNISVFAVIGFLVGKHYRQTVLDSRLL